MAGEMAGTARDVARLVGGAGLRRRCAQSTARRLVQGAGSAGVVAYRQDPQQELQVLAHGVSGAGDWLLALADASGLSAHTQTEVRIQVDQLGAPAEIRVHTASLHALGTLRPLAASEAELLLADDAVSDPVRDAAGAAGSCLAMAEVGSVLVHAREDVEKLPWSEVSQAAAFPRVGQEWQAVDSVAALAGSTVGVLLQDLAQGTRRGILGRPMAGVPHCGGEGPRHLLLDVDTEGCTWLVAEGGQVRTAFLAFDQPVRDEGDLLEALRSWRTAAA
ncbi:hypothetical protein [Nesterenkonia xinjiangensis]|uniref:Uncharacterized protein n=1 Tax=Nesterenkonia xinjiangensis TaxID=225327 RepID=A0A7Z0K8F8_9MICC|nr:hypothetical protein [Nesterenkonia xinjiangensis]NYJ76623.1 hypothetical protein [Nesterenkonia xinjiangensis]